MGLLTDLKNRLFGSKNDYDEDEGPSLTTVSTSATSTSINKPMAPNTWLPVSTSGTTFTFPQGGTYQISAGLVTGSAMPYSIGSSYQDLKKKEEELQATLRVRHGPSDHEGDMWLKVSPVFLRSSEDVPVSARWLAFCESLDQAINAGLLLEEATAAIVRATADRKKEIAALDSLFDLMDQAETKPSP